MENLLKITEVQLLGKKDYLLVIQALSNLEGQYHILLAFFGISFVLSFIVSFFWFRVKFSVINRCLFSIIVGALFAVIGACVIALVYENDEFIAPVLNSAIIIILVSLGLFIWGAGFKGMAAFIKYVIFAFWLGVAFSMNWKNFSGKKEMLNFAQEMVKEERLPIDINHYTTLTPKDISDWQLGINREVERRVKDFLKKELNKVKKERNLNKVIAVKECFEIESEGLGLYSSSVKISKPLNLYKVEDCLKIEMANKE